MTIHMLSGAVPIGPVHSKEGEVGHLTIEPHPLGARTIVARVTWENGDLDPVLFGWGGEGDPPIPAITAIFPRLAELEIQMENAGHPVGYESDFSENPQTVWERVSRVAHAFISRFHV